ncbi:hypothetical protein OIU34_00090 [Pararhizobium sp. BT-229]|uniref:hypothetical protein n=1 Tax=Pararhizobium sp. BT-229 TaxID=2986923 RepID=UPI0021F7A7D7|nr:hypothetical protein [Pararhizobium sp. BT-229]MCV9960287.1 hypothetical protein [Pararhizobium sp. BT-229]
MSRIDMKFSWKDINWLWVAGVFTVAYAVLIGYGLGLARVLSFVTTEPDLNEVGDFLAGVFAPVALIWLVAAVLTQRQELNETRDQFTENQKVVDAQLKTINSQNGLLAMQHNQAVENAKQAYKLNLFDKRFQIYEKVVKFGEIYEARDFDDTAYTYMTNLSQEAGFVFDYSIETWLDDIAREIYDYLEFKKENPLIQGFSASDREFNATLREKYEMNKTSIFLQFSPSERTERLWRFMSVSDQPYMEAG